MNEITKFKRLDKHLVDRGLVATLPRAHQLIMAGAVRVNGAVIEAPQCPINDEHKIEISGIDCPWVSAEALALFTALDVLKIDVKGSTALDVGAGKGGFTEVLLQKQAKKVFAVEKEFGLLDPSLMQHPRVKNLYNLDAKTLTPEIISESIDMIVCDIADDDVVAVVANVMQFAKGRLHLLVFGQDKSRAKDIERQLRIDHGLLVKKVPDTLQTERPLIWLNRRAL